MEDEKLCDWRGAFFLSSHVWYSFSSKCILKTIGYWISYWLGKKNKSIPLSIIFEESQFFHLAGLQHLTDRITLLFGERSEIFRKILIGTISAKQIESSVFYSEIADRFKYLSFLETIMDSNKTILKYNPQLEAFSSLMADFLLKNELQARNIFTFLSKDNLRGKYFCRSFFPQTDKDYSKNQTNWTLLYKKEVKKSTGQETILLDKVKK